jgi:hypothetical protein
MHPRVLVLKKIGLVFGLGSSFFVILFSLIDRFGERIPKAYSAFLLPSSAQVVLSLTFLYCCIHLFHLLQNREIVLRESEQYLILILLAVLLSAWFGAGNYAVYFFNPASFAIDKDLKLALKTPKRTNGRIGYSDLLGLQS